MPETYKSFGTALGTTFSTTIYPGVVGTAIVNSINISNIDNLINPTVSIQMIKGSTAYSIIRNAQIPTSSSLQVLDAPMVLESNNTLTAITGYTGDIEIIVSVLEITV